MTGRLEDKVAVITGSSSGIGRSIALMYAAEGAYVVCSDIDPVPKGDAGKPTHEAINETHHVAAGGKSETRAIFVRADASVSDDLENLVKECAKAFGRLDIMVNNAGISPIGLQPPGARIHETPEASWDKIMGLNGKGVWLGCKFAAVQMLSQDPHSSGDRGWIINMTSVLGTVGSPGSSTYTASKHAVIGITKSIALEYGKDRMWVFFIISVLLVFNNHIITPLSLPLTKESLLYNIFLYSHVNAIAPGFVETPLLAPFANENSEDPHLKAVHSMLVSLHPFDSRLGKAEEIAGAAVFLASKDAAWVTGATLQVDGGYAAH
ncbi:hypothetical protein ACO22_05954 [Paracoccidioides brasiliensis]|uniref:Uncharacterized protein n=1 Tax=Paracoccidioides brasiliensis TaxID=121759 RepID=A0A1D2J8V6_PARBR|nr:hypothetical protein ACO22_05954 [Paracoccidioides brasiliensis]